MPANHTVHDEMLAMQRGEHRQTRRIYLAARYSRSTQLRAIRDSLQRAGYEITSRWIDGGHELTKEGSTQAAEAERTRFAMEDYSDLCRADTVISFTEEPRKTTTRGGRHVEFGIAIERGQRNIVIGHRENVFHCLPGVEFYETWGQAQEQLGHPPALHEPVAWRTRFLDPIHGWSKWTLLHGYPIDLPSNGEAQPLYAAHASVYGKAEEEKGNG